MARSVGLAFRDVQGKVWRAGGACWKAGEAVWRNQDSDPEVEEQRGGSLFRGWGQLGCCGGADGAGDSLGAVQGQAEPPDWDGGRRSTQIVLLRPEVVGFGDRK